MTKPGKAAPADPDPLAAKMARLDEIEQKLLAVTEELEQERGLFLAGPVVLFRCALGAGGWLPDFISQNVAELLGYGNQELLVKGPAVLKLIHPDDHRRVLDEARAALRGGQDKYAHQPFRLLTRDGQVVWVRVANVFVRDKNGVVDRCIGQLIDITELIATQQMLEEHRQRWAFALEGAGDGVWDWDVPSGAVFRSRQWGRLLGYETDALAGGIDEWRGRLHPDDARRAWKSLEEHLEGREPYYQSQYRLRCKDGSYRWFMDRGKAVARDSSGRPLRIIGTFSDITERKATQERLQLVFDFSLDLICTAGFDGFLRELNPAWRRQLGWSPQELRARPYIEFVHPDDQLATLDAAQRLSRGEHVLQFENRYRCKDGPYRWLSWNSYPDLDQRLIYAVVRDVTDGKLAKEKLAQSEGRFRQLVDNISEFFWIADSETGRLIYANQAFKQAWGNDGRMLEQNPLTMFDHTHQDDALAVAQALTSMRRDKTPLDISFRVNGPDGRERWIYARTFAIRDQNGHIYRWAGLAEDISRQKKLEQELTRLANTDSLTGLVNRMRFMDCLAKEFNRSRRYQRPLSLAMLDLDHFKRINDAHGHVIGDEALGLFARTCRETLRQNDVLGRIGGEEFALLLPETDLAGALPVAQRLRQAVAAMRLPTAQGLIGLTVSIGLTQRFDDESDVESFLRRADEALYRAKDNGRDRVEIIRDRAAPG